jgi:hypothetical protein
MRAVSEMKGDLDELKTFQNSLRSRAEQTAPRRKKLENPPI